MMVDPLELAGDVVTGATALAGLVLVYLGMAVSGFGTFDREQQATVRTSYQIRAWFAFVGMMLAIVSAMLAVIGKWAHNGCVVAAGIVLLLLALIWGIALAFLTVREIR